ncbi:OPT superfamily oligopeptide transporter [Rhizoclosmatium globosum]|uniref:OPT superfamily oligopeptide transporter n=1 Tax=Rhizoclosmatium globosum TaxID=329046 RepID=A0A1Y2CF78_9FUNG|nr:OPT superfamily oligopeptide transporter [Rhizoclosmatium globosum]|eukprot:ORY45728.1 OPT superfamily oligopeptide transporter [Rhizoclosmatium globosum]
MTKTADLVAEKEQQLEELKQAHPELEDDVELSDIKEVEERIDFIVPQTDDPSTPAFTFRSVLLANIALILSYPMGLFLAAVLPSGALNPGPFSMKEHVLIYIMASCAGVPYGIENVVSQVMPELMGNTDITFIHSLGFVLVTQFLGYGLSGLTRRFLVRPTAMWWPANLPVIALFTSFHKVETGEIDGVQKYKTTRFQMFWIAFAAMFVWTWIPQYFAQGLQAISLLCLIGGRGSGTGGKLTEFNAVAASAYNGIGVLGITLDWTSFGSLWNYSLPMDLCSHALRYRYLGLKQKITKDTVNGNPLLNTPHLPNYFFDATKNYDLNITAYNDVAPVYITSFFALVYGCSFLTITAAISHVVLWYGKDIYRQSMNAFRQVRDEVDSLDKHVKMMEAYPDIPDWAYLAFLGVTTIGALLVSVFTPFNMPWWGIFFNIFLCCIFILPFGIVPAVSGFYLYLNVLTEFVIGLMIPGQTVAVMAFKSWGTNSLAQALTLTQDLKLGQYLHIPPYAMVFAQFWGTFLNAIVSTIACYFMMFGSKELLQKDEWQYNGHQTFYSAGGIWGAIGPQRFFGIGSLYEGLCGYIAKSKYWHYLNFSIFYNLGSAGSYQVTIVVPVILAFVAQYLFKRNKEFYQKYFWWIRVFDGFVLFFGNINPPFWALNPDTDVVKGDYYCYPGATFKDYDCDYYLRAGKTKTHEGIVCKK